jgi:hypothetical protein
VGLDPEPDVSVRRGMDEIEIRQHVPDRLDDQLLILEVLNTAFADEQVLFDGSVVVRTETIEGIRLQFVGQRMLQEKRQQCIKTPTSLI